MNDQDALVGRIVADPQICHGKPRIKGSRIMVWQILDLLADGESAESIRAKHYPDITIEDIRACIAYATQYVQEEVHPVSTPIAH